jgi:hypothetical protein
MVLCKNEPWRAITVRVFLHELLKDESIISNRKIFPTRHDTNLYFYSIVILHFIYRTQVVLSESCSGSFEDRLLSSPRTVGGPFFRPAAGWCL